VLLDLLNDESVFVTSWAIVSLCILGRKYPKWKDEILDAVAALQSDPSIAIRTKVRNALVLLSEETAVFPKGWVKSQHLGSL
jgi:HEAT repeat protein